MKKYRRVSGITAGGIAALAIIGSAFGFSGLSNGSFESGPSVGSFVQVNPGNTIDGWTVEVAVDYIGTYFAASNGSRSIDMNASPSQGVISQTFATVTGATYDVTFDLSGNPACSRGPKVLRVAATEATPLDVTFDTALEANTLSNMKWRQEIYSFVATGTSTTLSFASQSGSNCGPALDNVAVTETLPPPPPVFTAADCKKGGWQGMIDHLGNGFKNQGDCVSYFATDTRNLGAIKP
ncbi:MAG: choice-of-anchor C family protein [Dehalococcoidia bacterium]|nr:choice-of-anchor C family protein [Dehalococcoidia bacterium]